MGVGCTAGNLGRALIVALVVLGVAVPSAGAYTPDQTALMNAGVEETRQESGYPGLIVGVWTEGQGSFIATPGVAEIATGREIVARDQTRIGSITKTFTATVVLQLAQEGLIGLDDPVKKYLDRVPRGREITVRMLLNHTSGLPDLPLGVFIASLKTPHHNWRPNQIIFRGLRGEPVGPPGGQWSYSNLGYIMLGAIAEQVTGKSIRALYRERVFEPLGLRATTFRPSGRLPKGAVHGYLLRADGTFSDTFDWNFSWAFSAGAMVSSLPDLKRYVRALATGKGLLSKRMQLQRLTTVPTGTGLDYGLGIFEVDLGSTEPQPYLGHNAIVYGYDAFAVYSPVTNTTIVLLGNTAVEEDAFPNNEPHPDFYALADYLAAIAQGQSLSE